MTALPIKRERTHTLTISIPLHLDDAESFDYDPVYTALSVVMSVSRMAVDGVVCDDVNVSLQAAPPEVGA